MSDAIVVEHLSYTYAGREQPTIDDVSLVVPPATITLLAGRTGSGKSTLLRAMAGWIPRHSRGRMTGRVLVDGLDTRTVPTVELARRVGLVGQSIDDQLCSTTVASEIAFGLANLDLAEHEIHQRLGAALKRFDLAGLDARPPQQLSSGQRVRVLLASLWAMRPRVLLLDEPLAQLDTASAAALLGELRRLRDEGMSVVVAEHRHDAVVPIADRTVMLGEPVVAATREPSARTTEPGELLIEARGLAARYHPAPQCVWQGLDFALRAGERVAIVGPNGAGKSTLLEILAGLLRPAAGTRDCRAAPIGLVTQRPDLMLFSASVRDELAFAPRAQRQTKHEVDRRVEQAARQFALESLLDEPPQALSHGQRLRVAVAATLTLDPRVLLVDEPTAGQDPEQAEALLDALSRAVDTGRLGALVFTTHDMHAARRWATRIVALEGTQPSAAGDWPGANQRTTIDARWKIAYLAALSIASVTVDGLPALAGVAAAGLAPWLFVRPGRRAALGVAALLAATVWATVLAQALFYPFEPRTPLATLCGISLWREGAFYGLVQSLRMVGTTAAGLAVCFSTSPERLLVALVQLGAPATAAFLTTTALRFLPTIGQEWLAIRQAQRLRAPSRRGLNASGTLMPLIASSLRRASRLAVSMTTRGFDPGARRTIISTTPACPTGLGLRDTDNRWGK